MVPRILSDEQKQRGFLAKKSITKFDHPLYSPDVAPCDFWLFPELKIALKGHRFYDISDIQCHVLKELNTIPGDQFQECFEQWKHCLQCISTQGNYFEGDSGS
jgi:hypothetical protein